MIFYTFDYRHEPLDAALCIKAEKAKRAYNRRIKGFRAQHTWIPERSAANVERETARMKKCRKNALCRIALEYELIAVKVFRQQCRNYGASQ